MRKPALAAALCLFAAHAAADVPAGWKSHADKTGKCEIATPADWQQTELGQEFIASPDKKAQAFIAGGDLPFSTFKQVLLPMDQFKGAKVLKNTDSLYYAELKGNNPSKRTLYVDNSTEAAAKKIGDSLRVK